MKAITHDGIFHADDVMSAAILSHWANAQYADLCVERRMPSEADIEDETVIVFDTGGVYNPIKKCFDPQKGGAAEAPNGTPLSAAVAIWLNLGEVICGDSRVANRVYEQLIAPIDALANGMGNSGDLSFSKIIAGFNPPANSDAKEREAAFNRAVLTCTEVLVNSIREAVCFFRDIV